MDPGEREATLTLVPYFNQNYRVVVDIGSNKGEWSDLLIQNTDLHELYEPNEKLLHYTEIKYCELKHVSFIQRAISNKSETKQKFYLWENSHNGLSGLTNNWPDLNPQETHVKTNSLDDFTFDHIDFLKIDVEGSEWEVIEGAKWLLENHKIKFIQIEYSDHYEVAGYTFKQIIDFLGKFGYFLYDFNGRNFFRAKFTENFKRKNYYFMQEFTEDWNHEFRANTLGMKINFALEIGCFEGLTTCYICDFLLNPGGRVVCIDPLQDEYLTEDIDEEAVKMNGEFKMFKGQYERFIRNTKGKPVELQRKTSKEAFTPEFFKYKFDFIYIDGDHRETSVYDDAVRAWHVLQEGGHMLFDDYKWDATTKRGIDRFLKDFSGHYTTKIKSYQVMIRKNVVE